MNSKLLIDESPLQVLPTLAMRIGLNEAIFTQQLHYILNNVDGKKFGKIDGNGICWVRNSIPEWLDIFQFWDKGILNRTIKNLVSDKVILTRTFSGRCKWYTLSYQRLGTLDGPVERVSNKHAKRYQAQTHRVSEQNVPIDPIGTKCSDTSEQNVPIIGTKCSSSKTPSENTSKKDTTTANDKNLAAILKQIGILCKQHFADPERNLEFKTDLMTQLTTHGAKAVLDAINLAISPDRANGRPKTWGYVKGILNSPDKPKQNGAKNGRKRTPTHRPSNSKLHEGFGADSKEGPAVTRDSIRAAFGS